MDGRSISFVKYLLTTCHTGALEHGTVIMWCKQDMRPYRLLLFVLRTHRLVFSTARGGQPITGSHRQDETPLSRIMIITLVSIVLLSLVMVLFSFTQNNCAASFGYSRSPCGNTRTCVCTYNHIGLLPPAYCISRIIMIHSHRGSAWSAIGSTSSSSETTRVKQIFGPVIAEYNPWFGKPSTLVHQRAHMAKQCNSSPQVPCFFLGRSTALL
jgi:hypothetical protein